MPWYQFIFGAGASDKFEDDAPDAGALHERVFAARRTDPPKLVTSVTVELEPPTTKKVDGKDVLVPAVTGPEITGSWDATDIRHVIPFEEVLDVELEGEGDEEGRPPVNPSLLAGKRK